MHQFEPPAPPGTAPGNPNRYQQVAAQGQRTVPPAMQAAASPPVLPRPPVPSVFTVVLAGGIGALLVLFGFIFLTAESSVDLVDDMREITSDGLKFLGLALGALGSVSIVMAARSLRSHQELLRSESAREDTPPVILLVGLFCAAAVLIMVILSGVTVFTASMFRHEYYGPNDDLQGIAVLMLVAGFAGFTACVAAGRGAAWGRVLLLAEVAMAFVWYLSQVDDIPMNASILLVLAWFVLIAVSLVVPPTNLYIAATRSGATSAPSQHRARQPQSF